MDFKEYFVRTKCSDHKLKYISVLDLYAPKNSFKIISKKVTELHGEVDKSIYLQS